MKQRTISAIILLTIMIFVSTAFVGFMVGLAFDNGTVAYFTFLFALIALMIQLMVGFRNKHTANDNTSGIITLTRILESLPQEQRKKVCVIYFDNEEKLLCSIYERKVCVTYSAARVWTTRRMSSGHLIANRLTTRQRNTFQQTHPRSFGNKTQTSTITAHAGYTLR